MTTYLVCMSGNGKGRTWPIRDSWVTVGRAGDCEVVLDDDSVSRHHCRIRATGNQILLEGLKNLNPMLVNGRPVNNSLVQPGDEIAVGISKFMVVAQVAISGGEEGSTRERPTVSWDDASPVWLQPNVAKEQMVSRPGTVHDLAFLYDTARALSSLRSISHVLAELNSRLRERFRPVRFWIARVAGDDAVDLLGAEGGVDTANHFPDAVVKDALLRGHGLLAPKVFTKEGKRLCRFILVAPVFAGSMTAAVLVLQTETPEGAYDEEDLRLLVLLSELLGPILFSVEAFEQLERDNEYLRSCTEERLGLVGQSRAMGHVRRMVSQAAASDLHVTITGETGTGKELVARLIHERGPNRAKPFVVVNCAAIPKDLFESEFFGYEKGAFTGAERDSEGLFAQADGGTLFLDEVGDLSLENQARILRAIELGVFRRIGAKQETHVQIRVLAATNKELGVAIKEGAFREDLYHRLSGFEIHIPPLRERPSDIPVLAEYFLELAKSHSKRPLRGFSPQAIDLLKARLWPGNVRELRNCVLRAISTGKGEEIQPGDIRVGPPVLPSGDGEQVVSLAEMEKQHITTILRRCGGNVREAAELLKIGRSTLYVKLAEHGIR